MLETLVIGTLLFALLALIGRGTTFTSDEGQIFNTALALLRGTLAIAPGENVHQGPDGPYYACREIFPSLVSVPPAAAGLVLEYCRLPPPPAAPGRSPGSSSHWPIFLSVTLLGPLFASLCLLALHAFLRAEGARPGWALVLTFTAAFSTPLMVYSKTIFPQVFEAACVMFGVLLARNWVRERRPGAGWFLGLVCLVGMTTRVIFAPVGLCLAAYLALAGTASVAARIGVVARVVAGMVVGGAITGWVNSLRWGSPLDFGYHHPYETFSTPFHVGLSGLLVSPGKGLLVFAPILVLPCVFIRRLWTHGRAEVLLVVGITVVYLALYSRWYDWHGGLCWGPRFLVPLIAPWMALAGRALRPAPPSLFWLLGGTLAVVGFAVQCLGAAVNPHCMNRVDSDIWSLSHNHIVGYLQTVGESGVDDFWLLAFSTDRWATTAVLAAGLGGLAVLAAGTLRLVAFARTGRRV